LGKNPWGETFSEFLMAPFFFLCFPPFGGGRGERGRRRCRGHGEAKWRYDEVKSRGEKRRVAGTDRRYSGRRCIEPNRRAKMSGEISTNSERATTRDRDRRSRGARRGATRPQQRTSRAPAPKESREKETRPSGRRSETAQGAYRVTKNRSARKRTHAIPTAGE